MTNREKLAEIFPNLPNEILMSSICMADIEGRKI